MPLMSLTATIVMVLVMTAGCGINVAATDAAPATQPVVMIGQPDVVIPNPPVFIMPPSLGFHVGVGVPYDIVFAYDNFYLYYGTTWYRASGYAGPWTIVQYDSLPPIIRAQKIENIRKYRELEYRLYRRNPSRYRGRSFLPEKR